MDDRRTFEQQKNDFTITRRYCEQILKAISSSSTVSTPAAKWALGSSLIFLSDEQVTLLFLNSALHWNNLGIFKVNALEKAREEKLLEAAKSLQSSVRILQAK